MSRVIDELFIKHPDKKFTYAVLILDAMPEKLYRKFLIRGKEYTPVPVYDMKNCIAIISDESFIGETIDFI